MKFDKQKFTCFHIFLLKKDAEHFIQIFPYDAGVYLEIVPTPPEYRVFPTDIFLV